MLAAGKGITMPDMNEMSLQRTLAACGAMASLLVFPAAAHRRDEG